MANGFVIPETDVLSSWKEIATYLGRGVRTVQRWETELQMPVYRPRGKSRSAVVAMKSEIEQWIKSRSLQVRGEQLAVARASIDDRLAVGYPSIACGNELVASARALRADVRRSRQMLHDSLAKLMGTLEGIVKTTPSRIAPLTGTQVM